MNIPESLLEVKIDDEIFGVDSSIVDQILRVPPIIPIPLTSNAFRGVCVIGGKIIGVVDLSTSFKIGAVDEKKEETRLVNINLNGELYSLLVDEVVGMVFVDENNFELPNEETKKISGFYKDNGNVCQVVSVKEVINELDVEAFHPLKIEKLQDKKDKEDAFKNDEHIRYLFFNLGLESFAIDTDIVKELVFPKDEITPIPESPSNVLGMITLRDKIINTLDFSITMGFGKIDRNSKNRLIVTQSGDKEICLLVDSVNEVKDVLTSKLEPLPENFVNKKIQAILKENNGDIVSIIGKVFLNEIIDKYHVDEEQDSSHIKQDSLKEKSMIEVVIFRMDNEEFALPIENVQEIIKFSEITPMPDAPDSVEGVINLRGVVIPVVSLQERLGFEKNITDKTKILICNLKKTKVGFLVDDVSETLSIDESNISEAKSDDTLFDNVINLDDGKRIILKLRIDRILADEDLKQINLEKGDLEEDNG